MDLHHPDVPLYIAKKQAFIMPEKLRAKGIASKVELIFALAPYMEWMSTQQVIDRYKQFMPVQDEHEILRRLSYLCTKNLFERREGPKRGWRSTKEWRRIERGYIDNSSTRQARLDGNWFGRVRKPRQEKPLDKLTMDDVRFIQKYEGSITIKELAKMHKIGTESVKKIQKGRLPRHLRSKRSE